MKLRRFFYGASTEGNYSTGFRLGLLEPMQHSLLWVNGFLPSKSAMTDAAESLEPWFRT